MKKEFTARIVPLDETYELAHKLALLLMKESGKFDMVMAIARGGMPPSRFICDFLNIKRLTSIQIRHYTDGAKKHKNTEILDVPEANLKGKSILLIDDVNDTGDTLKTAVEYLQNQETGKVTTAVLHEKDTTHFEADFTANRLSKWKWLIFQWAVTEDVLGFIHKDGMADKSKKDIKQYLMEKYELEIENDLLDKILQLEKNYYGSDSK